MLQTATWELGRRQRMLLPLATPVYLALRRSISHTNSCNAAEPQTAVSAGGDNAHAPSNSDDPFAAKFAARRTTGEPKRKSRKGASFSGNHGSRISDNIDRDFFSEKFAARRTMDEPAPTSEVWDTEESRPGTKDEPVEEQASGYTSLVFRPENFANETEDTHEGGDFDWILDSFKAPSNLRPREHETEMIKSFTDRGPNFLISRSTFSLPDRDSWREKVASMRSFRLPVIVLQMMIRKEVLRNPEAPRGILDLLPKGEQRRTLVDIMSSNGYSRQDIDDMIYVIEGQTDQERCERFLENKTHRPIWLFHFVIRSSARINSVTTLNDLIEYCRETYDGRRDWSKEEILPGRGNLRSKMAMLSMSPETFGFTLEFLAVQCMLVEARLLSKVADLAAQYIKNMSTWDQLEDKIFNDQCLLFNTALGAFAPSQKQFPPQVHRPISLHWEAQRSLLSMSASLDRQLLVDRLGFRSVREVLAGLEKNAAEMHNSNRHAQRWPPYLEPGDGIDEMMDPEDNWSRSVSAGTLQQEAGFALDRRDLTLDILQGRAPDGTPTIQTRLTRPPNPNMGLWEASIKATRNAEEAWARFQTPPEPGAQPGVHEFGAMFAKLCLRDADPDAKLRPGDRALNFPTRPDPNLTEFTRSRMQPPSVDELYIEMRRRGLRPHSACLETLVANAKTLEMGHKYLRDSREKTWPLMVYRSGGPTAKSLREVRTPLVAAYVRLICNLESKPGRELFRAVRICDKRFEDDDGSRIWAPYMWGLILKAFSAKTTGLGRLGRTLAEQLRVYHQVVDQIENRSILRLPTLTQFSKCLRKAAARALGEKLRDLESVATAEDSPIRFLYDRESREKLAEKMTADDEENGREDDENPWLYFLSLGSSRMQDMFRSLTDREAEAQNLIEMHDLESLEHMLIRGDPVRARDAYELMASWAFLGEYEEMASFLEWLLQQWDSPALLEQLEGVDEIPASADLYEALCVFRLFAEPMLSEDQVTELRDKIDNASVNWAWPTDEVVTAFCETREDPSFRKLSHVLEWTRYRQARSRGEDPETLLRPEKWQEPESDGAHAYSRSGGPLWDMGAQ